MHKRSFIDPTLDMPSACGRICSVSRCFGYAPLLVLNILFIILAVIARLPEDPPLRRRGGRLMHMVPATRLVLYNDAGIQDVLFCDMMHPQKCSPVMAFPNLCLRGGQSDLESEGQRGSGSNEVPENEDRDSVWVRSNRDGDEESIRANKKLCDEDFSLESSGR